MAKLTSGSPSTPSSAVSPVIAACFHALSEPLRLQILDLLRNQELCVCDLSEALGISQSKLSFHLKVLKEAELLRSRQEGRWVYYSIDLPKFVVLEQYLADYRRFSPIAPARPCE
ncbi:MAG: winged helix-turn-helix transcriptional regulator [Oscillatoriophycideae cyanobacterium NC_groundwater_1537_Pr4_S-0.65um_50_18]|nr:winged helix-turn-helix transcriptional regulator [Oscillatoriophycideae cyanobacterium NC_groundwater_1537_Pr4_S-0.65um_50_18]